MLAEFLYKANGDLNPISVAIIYFVAAIIIICAFAIISRITRNAKVRRAIRASIQEMENPTYNTAKSSRYKTTVDFKYDETNPKESEIFIEFADEVLLNEVGTPHDITMAIIELMDDKGWVGIQGDDNGTMSSAELNLMNKILPVLKFAGCKAGLRENNFIGDPPYGIVLTEDQLEDWGINLTHLLPKEDILLEELYADEEEESLPALTPSQLRDYHDYRMAGYGEQDSYEMALDLQAWHKRQDCKSFKLDYAAYRAPQIDKISKTQKEDPCSTLLHSLNNFKLPNLPQFAVYPSSNSPREWTNWILNAMDTMKQFGSAIDSKLHEVEQAVANFVVRFGGTARTVSVKKPDTIEVQYWLDPTFLTSDIDPRCIVDIFHIDKVFNFETSEEDYDFVEVHRSIPVTGGKRGLPNCFIKWVKQDEPGVSEFSTKVDEISGVAFTNLVRSLKSSLSVHRTRVVVKDENDVEWSFDYYHDYPAGIYGVLATAYVPAYTTSFVIPDWIKRNILEQRETPYNYVDLDLAYELQEKEEDDG